FLAETAHPKHRGVAAAWAPFGAISGILLGSLAGAIILNVLPLEDVVAGGWRIPFLLGVVVGGVGFILRRRMPHDWPAAAKGFPVLDAVRNHPTRLLQVVGLSMINAAVFYILFVYIIAWLKKSSGMGASTATIINSVNMAIMVVLIMGIAW